MLERLVNWPVQLWIEPLIERVFTIEPSDYVASTISLFTRSANNKYLTFLSTGLWVVAGKDVIDHYSCRLFILCEWMNWTTETSIEIMHSLQDWTDKERERERQRNRQRQANGSEQEGEIGDEEGEALHVRWSNTQQVVG